jgi:hypothetical protein
MLNPDIIANIRHIFLHPRPHVSVMTAANLLGWTLRQMKAAIAAGEIETNVTPLATWVWREELMAKALELWPFDVIEEALGDDAARVLPRFIRTHVLRARVPWYQFEMLQHLARKQSTTISDVLTRELEDFAISRADELTHEIHGLGFALAWPFGGAMHQTC